VDFPLKMVIFHSYVKLPEGSLISRVFRLPCEKDVFGVPSKKLCFSPAPFCPDGDGKLWPHGWLIYDTIFLEDEAPFVSFFCQPVGLDESLAMVMNESCLRQSGYILNILTN